MRLTLITLMFSLLYSCSNSQDLNGNWEVIYRNGTILGLEGKYYERLELPTKVGSKWLIDNDTMVYNNRRKYKIDISKFESDSLLTLFENVPGYHFKMVDYSNQVLTLKSNLVVDTPYALPLPNTFESATMDSIKNNVLMLKLKKTKK